MPSPSQMKVNQLARLVGTPNAPILLDVRIDQDFDDDPRLIPTAIRCPHTDVLDKSAQLIDKHIVVYCQKGLKLSEGVTAMLRANGIAAESLHGGHFAWRDSGQPMIRADRVPYSNQQAPGYWVTRQRPKIDRIACPWLIRRFVDRQAMFMFVAPSQVQEVADKFGAIPFDIEGVHWSHRGEFCTFDTMLEEFELETEPLLHLATIIRGADTQRHELAPEAAGMMAALLGLSRMYRDDNTQLDAGMLIFDAFYRWSRDAIKETHDWPTVSPPKG